MKKKYFNLLIILSLLFSGNTMVHAEEEIIEESIIIEETTTSTPAEAVHEENETEANLDLPTTEATLRIETTTGGEIFNETITVTACKPYEASVEYTLNAKCLIDQTEGLNTVWNFFGTDAFLDSVNGISNDFGANLFWGYFINNEYGSIALNTHPLTEGNEILLVYGVNPLKIEIDSINPILNTTTTVQVYEFGLDEFWNPVWLPSHSSTILIDGVEYSTSENGVAEVKFAHHDSYTIQASKDGFAKSNTINIETTLPTIETTLYAVANGTILFHDTVEVTACKPYEASVKYTLNAKCLIDQAVGLTTTWNSYGTDAFLNSINEYTNDFTTNNFWGYFINLEYASVALNAYTLTEGDEILIQYNTTPLKLELSTTTPVVGDSITLSVFEFGLDEFWNPIWMPSTNSIITINGEVTEVPSSTLNLSITTTSLYTLRVEKTGYVTREVTFTAGTAPEPTTPPSSGNSGGSGGSNGQNTTPAQSMINFLDTKQNTDGSFGTTAFLSDWAAIAYGAWTGSSLGESKLTNYLLTNPSPLDGPNETTNYARRAMALMALGINPYTGTQTNYINEIIKGFDGTQFGEMGLINDDIFALTPLLRSGYSTNDALIVSTTKYIIANQDTNGSFGSIDLTGAAAQALSELSSIPGVSEALTKAKNYLTLAQQADGGFGNVYATGWVMQGIAALGENSTNWNNNGNTPVTYIQSKQASDGGMLSGDTDSNRIWATSYALPGILNKPWHTILTSFSKPSSGTGSTGSSDTTGSTSSTTTTTSTPTIVTTPTSTPTST
ncbi:MAG: DUF4430 domain-containing protein, partial [Candidatus Magasanikbacteria bacterium]|nr:DUF4430 domain-containing protein [Candidatus Magasanikbacteria bacterium]